MYIKIYFSEKPVFLCDEIDKELNEILHHPDVVFVDEINTAAIKSLLHEIKKDEFHAGVLWNEDLNKLKKAFLKQTEKPKELETIKSDQSLLTTLQNQEQEAKSEILSETTMSESTQETTEESNTEDNLSKLQQKYQSLQKMVIFIYSK